MTDDYDPNVVRGYMNVFCQRCKENHANCRTIEAYRECVKWCEDCCGTTRQPIPLAEVQKIRGEQ